MIYIGLLCLLFVHQAAHGFTTDNKTDEHRLFDKLMQNYNRASRPVYNASNAVDVSLSINLIQILDMVTCFYVFIFV
jgi:hypothetical protein